MKILPSLNPPDVFIEWLPEFGLGIPELDVQHRMLLDLINVVAKSVFAGDPEATESAMARLLGSSIAHFDFEEKLMQRMAYPESDLHHEQHSELLASLERLQADLSNRRFVVNRTRTLHFLRDWFSIHIVRTDGNFARFLSGTRGFRPGDVNHPVDGR